MKKGNYGWQCNCDYSKCSACAGIGIKLVPQWLRAQREWRGLRSADELNIWRNDSAPMQMTVGKRRESSIVGLYKNTLRHTDSSFTRAYRVALTPSVFSDDLVIENRCHALARLLAARKPVGTVIQFRLSTGLDPGQALVQHAQARDQGSIHQTASLLHDSGLATYADLADAGSFRCSVLTPLIPTESEWNGAPRPHRLFSLPTGKLIGVDLFDRQLVSAPLVLALAAPRGGKSVLLGRIINDVLACKACARVRAVDFGESFGPLVDVLVGRHLRFEAGTEKTINVWDCDGLESGILPDEVQVGFVVGDLLPFARVPAEDSLAEDILTTLVNEVYRNEVPRNRPGLPKHEPRLSHLVDYLSTWPFKGAAAERAEALKLALNQFVGHSFLDAPTHPDFTGD